jgi:hypothetical protein
MMGGGLAALLVIEPSSGDCAAQLSTTLINNASLGASTRFFADFPDRRTGGCHGNRTDPAQSAVCAFIRIALSALGIDSIGVNALAF